MSSLNCTDALPKTGDLHCGSCCANNLPVENEAQDVSEPSSACR